MFPRARTPDGEIEGAGGAYVRRRFTFGDRVLVNGDRMSAEELAGIPDNNLRSLINLNLIELYPAAPELSTAEAELRAVIAEKNAEIEHLRTSGPDLAGAAVALWLAQEEQTSPPPLVGSGDCFLMPDETGKRFHIIQGHQVTDEPLSRAKALAKMKELTAP